MEGNEQENAIVALLEEIVQLNRQMSSDLKELVVQQEIIIQQIQKTNSKMDKYLNNEQQ